MRPENEDYREGLSDQRIIDIMCLGLRPYRDVWEIQKSLQRSLMNGEGRDTLIICEHPAVITFGRGAEKSNLLVSSETLVDLGVESYEIERGGDVTYHGPGQIVGYPILNLNAHKRDVGWYMRSLEEVIIRTLQDFEIKGIRIPGKTGVWTEVAQNASNFEPKKAAAIGVRISRWCTLHGFSLNVRSCADGFSLINPCGFRSDQVTSMEEAGKASVDIEAVEHALIKNFCGVFKVTQGVR